jgi:hypothetical protein
VNPGERKKLTFIEIYNNQNLEQGKQQQSDLNISPDFSVIKKKRSSKIYKARFIRMKRQVLKKPLVSRF